MASMFSAYNPSAYKTYTPGNVKGTFGGPSNVMGGGGNMMGQGGAPQGNLQAIIDLIRKLNGPSNGQVQQPPMQQIVPGGESGLQSQENPAQNNLLQRIIGNF